MAMPRILIVDDQSNTTKGLARELRKMGYEVPDVVASGGEALSLAAQLRPDLAIVAIEPDAIEGGIDAATAIRADCGVPIIYACRSSDVDILDPARATAPYGYIFRPFHACQVRSVIEVALHRHSLERRLETREEQYRALVDQSLQGIMIIQGPPPCVAFANPKAVEMTGYALDELQALSPEGFAALVHPVDRGPLFAQLVDHMAGKLDVASGEYRSMRKDGTMRWIQYFASRVQFAGRPSLQVAFLDITDRKQAESERAAELDAVFDTMAGGVVIYEPDARIVRANDEARRILSLDASYQQMPINQRMQNRHFAWPDGRPADWAGTPLFQALHGETVRNKIMVVGLPTEGPQTWVSVSAAPLGGLEGEAPGAVVSLTDVTALHEVQEQLRSANDELRSRNAELAQLSEELESERARFVAIVEQMPAGVIIAEAPTGRMVFTNRQTEEILRDAVKLSAGPDEYLQYASFYPDGRPYTPAQLPLARTMATGEKVVDEEIGFVRSDGSSGTLVTNSSPVVDRQGQITASVLVFQDITERRRTEQALLESQERYRSLFQNALLGIYRVAPEGRLLIVNPALVRMLGYDSAEELLDRNVATLYAPGFDRAGYVEQIERDGHVTGTDATFRRRDGSTLFCRTSAVAVRDLMGQTLYYEGTIEDISQQVRAEQQLRAYTQSLEEAVLQRTRELQAERDRTRALLESLGEAVIVTDLEDRILYLNPAASSLVGVEREDALGQPIQTWRQEQSNGAENAIRAALATGTAWRGEMTMRHRDGIPRDLAVTVAPLFDHDSGQLIGAVWVERDITVLKDVDRLKDTFISNMSHELRTPLSVITLISGNLDMLYDRLGDERRLKMIRDLREHARVLNDLVGDVLDISRIASRRISLERGRVSLADTLRLEVEDQMPLAELSGLQLGTTADAAWVWANKAQLRQMVRNLVNNAVKYTPPGGQIVCECCTCSGQPARGEAGWPGSEALPPGAWAALRVVDTGTGIDAADLPHVFDRFYRAAAHAQTPGTGLGLAIVDELAKLHGGRVAVTSTPGQGSTFALYLPLLVEENDDGG